MSLQSVTEAIRNRVGASSGLNATVKFSFGNDGVVYLDGKSNPNTVSNDDKPADCTLNIALSDFEQMMTGQLDGMSAYMSGKLKVDGDLGVAMNLGGVLRGS